MVCGWAVCRPRQVIDGLPQHGAAHRGSAHARHRIQDEYPQEPCHGVGGFQIGGVAGLSGREDGGAFFAW